MAMNMCPHEGVTELESLYYAKPPSELFSLTLNSSNADGLSKLALLALEHFQLSTASMLYRKLSLFSHAATCQSFDAIEDLNYLKAEILAFMGEFDRAQEMYLLSFTPISALQMRRDLRHWDQALLLATSLSPQLVSSISMEFASQLESQGASRVVGSLSLIE